jgi:hypothetical protein
MTREKGFGGVAQAVEHLPSKHKALSPVSHTHPQKKIGKDKNNNKRMK